MFLCCGEYTGAQLAMRDRWVSGGVEMGLLWNRGNGRREASFPPNSHRPEGADRAMFSYPLSTPGNLSGRRMCVCVCVNVCRCVSMACMRMRVCTCSDMHVFGQRPQACSKQMIVKMSNDMEDCVNQFVVCTSTRRCSIHIAGCRMQVPGHPEPVLKFCRR